MFLRGAALLGLLSLIQPFPEKTLLDGSAQPCADVKETTSGVPGVHVYAFNAKKVPTIRKSLDALDTLEWEGGDPAAMRAASRTAHLQVRGMRSLNNASPPNSSTRLVRHHPRPYVPTSLETVAPRYLCSDGRRMDLQACRSHPMFLVEKTSPPRAGANGLRRA